MRLISACLLLIAAITSETKAEAPISAAVPITSAAPIASAAPISAAALAPDGNQVVLGSQAGLEIRSWPELVVVSALSTGLTNIHDLQFAPDGQTLLVAGGSPAESGVVEVWDWTSAKRIREVTGHDDLVYRVCWSPDGSRWVTASADGVCQVFTLAADNPVARYEGHSRAVLSACYLDPSTVASVGVDQTVQLWNADSGTHIRTLDNHVDTVNDLAIRPGVTPQSPVMIATVSEDRTVRLWQPMIGRLMRFARLPSTPRTVDWSGDGSRLIVGCNDGRIRLLDVDSIEVTRDLDGLHGRIHEVVLDVAGNSLLVAGETGYRRVSLVP